MALITCPGCGKEVSDRADACPNCGYPGKYFPRKELQIGDRYTFGRWGDEDIEWRVLDVKDDRALIIAEKAIDCKPYDEECRSITWKDCMLRSWLNGELLHGAFSSSEQERIAETTVANKDNAEDGTEGGPDTEDRVFCLSVDEADRYFANDDDRICYPTRYAEGNGVWTDDSGACCWWLRSPGGTQSFAAFVFDGGGILGDGDSVDDDSSGVRPALWLDL